MFDHHSLLPPYGIFFIFDSEPEHKHESWPPRHRNYDLNSEVSLLQSGVCWPWTCPIFVWALSVPGSNRYSWSLVQEGVGGWDFFMITYASSY